MKMKFRKKQKTKKKKVNDVIITPVVLGAEHHGRSIVWWSNLYADE
jgi:hypothetical protein